MQATLPTDAAYPLLPTRLQMQAFTPSFLPSRGRETTTRLVDQLRSQRPPLTEQLGLARPGGDVDGDARPRQPQQRRRAGDEGALQHILPAGGATWPLGTHLHGCCGDVTSRATANRGASQTGDAVVVHPSRRWPPPLPNSPCRGGPAMNAEAVPAESTRSAVHVPILIVAGSDLSHPRGPGAAGWGQGSTARFYTNLCRGGSS